MANGSRLTDTGVAPDEPAMSRDSSSRCYVDGIIYTEQEEKRSDLFHFPSGELIIISTRGKGLVQFHGANYLASLHRAFVSLRLFLAEFPLSSIRRASYRVTSLRALLSFLFLFSLPLAFPLGFPLAFPFAFSPDAARRSGGNRR